tara:strand:- start:165 stop:557 length:393 start_codon:yes stop_codon:yes gene_type:complete
MKKLLAILSVVLFANQASADKLKFEIGDIFSCMSKKFVDLDGIEKGDNISVFRVVEDIAMNSQSIQFGDIQDSSSYLRNKVLQIKSKENGVLRAVDIYRVFIMEDLDFYMASLDPKEMVLMMGKCKKLDK